MKVEFKENIERGLKERSVEYLMKREMTDSKT